MEYNDHDDIRMTEIILINRPELRQKSWIMSFGEKLNLAKKKGVRVCVMILVMICESYLLWGYVLGFRAGVKAHSCRR